MNASRTRVLIAVLLFVVASLIGGAVYMVSSLRDIRETLDFTIQKEYRNFARAPTLWQRLTVSVNQVLHEPTVDAFDEAYVALDLMKVRMKLLRSFNYQLYQRFADEKVQLSGAPSALELQSRMEEIEGIVTLIEDKITGLEEGRQPDLQYLDELLGQGDVLVQSIEAAMARYTLEALSEHTFAVDTFMQSNQVLMVVAMAALIVVALMAAYAYTQQAKLRAAVQAADAASRAKSSFVANMSHEIRTPLNAVIGLASLARDEALIPSVVDNLEKIEEAGQTLLSLVNDVLDFSKIESGKITLEETAFSLGEVLHQAKSLARSLTMQKNIGVVLDDHSLGEISLRGDPVKLGQVLNNFVSNAAKFTEEGEIRISVERPEKQPADGRRLFLRFCVSDTGIGIDQETQEKLFRPFTQADVSTSRRFGGTGLGLSIAKAIVELMGGSIEVESTVGEGTAFSFTVPFDRLEEEESIAVLRNGVASVSKLEGLEVLLVEDNMINRKLAGTIMERAGIVVHFAESGEVACRMTETMGPEQFNLILMDIQMPGIDGHETTRRLREEHGACLPPVIALTANAFSEERERALESGMQAFLRKPFTPPELLNAVRENAVLRVVSTIDK